MLPLVSRGDCMGVLEVTGPSAAIAERWETAAATSPRGDTKERRAEHDSEDQKRKLEAAQPEEHSLLASAAAGLTCR